MSQRSESLYGYSEFIAKIRELENQKPKPDLGAAVRGAISYCMDADILLDYFRKHGSEVVNMLFHEFKLEEALEVRFEEGRDEGIAEGHTDIFSLWEQGFTLEEAKKKLSYQQ